jgi:uncharacterized SAM-binding protein YcdF (DUF218 family)
MAVVCVGGIAAYNAGRFLVLSVPPDAPAAIVSLASHEWERLPEVVALAREYPHAAILLTVPVHVTEQNCHRCSDRHDVLVRAGIAADRIHILPTRVSNTHDEAVACLRFAHETNSSEIVVVTSPYHSRRAMATFRGVFGRTPVRLAVRPALAASPARPGRWWQRHYDRAYVAYEWAAIVYYAARFGIYPWNT